MWVISLEFAKKTERKKEFLLMPGHKVCGNCKSQLNKLYEKILSIVYDTALTEDSIDCVENTCAASLSNSQLNTSLSGIGQSPIKSHSMPSC